MSLALTANRATSGPDGPFAGVVLGISPVDSDLVKIGTPDIQRAYNGTGAIAADGIILTTMSGNELRFGRGRMQNVFGSERLPLSVPIQAQYWNGSNFVVNADDSCTALTVSAPQTLTTFVIPLATPTPANTAGIYFYPVPDATAKNQLHAADTTRFR